MAVITVQFDVGVKYNDTILRLYDKVHSNSDWLLPNLGVQTSIIKPKGIDDVPIVAFSHRLTVLRVSPVRLSISDNDSPSR